MLPHSYVIALRSITSSFGVLIPLSYVIALRSITSSFGLRLMNPTSESFASKLFIIQLKIEEDPNEGVMERNGVERNNGRERMCNDFSRGIDIPSTFF